MDISNNLIYTVLIFNLIIITFIMYILLKTNTNFFKRKPYFINLSANDYQTVINNWKTFGFSKIKNYISYDIDYINDFINFVEEKYPNMINMSYNNNLVSNINRKSIELVRDENGKPFPFAKGIKDYLEIDAFPNERIKKDFFENLGNNYLKEQGLNNSSEDKIDLLKADNVRRIYSKDSRKNDFFYFLKLFSEKLKKTFPDIIKPNLYIYHILVFYLYPGGKKQQAHCDKFYISNNGNLKKGEQVDSLQVFISLNDHELNTGPTTFYKRNMIDYDYLEKTNGGNRLWDKNLQNDPKIKNMFNNAMVKEKMNKGDIIFTDADVFHHGGDNTSNKIRKVLLIQYM